MEEDKPHSLAPKVQAFVDKHRTKKSWSSKGFLLFCKEGVALAKHYPQDKAEIAYWIVSKGSYFGGLATQDKDELRGQVRDLAMTLELPDHHVYIGDGLSVKQKWQLMEDPVNEGLEELAHKK